MCENHCSGIQGTFLPVGKLISTGTLVYARTELDSNGPTGNDVQYYFYLQSNGEWEFTYDMWIKPEDIDYDDFGEGKFENGDFKTVK